MNEYLEERLQSLIIKVLASQPARQKLSLKTYINNYKRIFVSVSNEALREAIDTFEQQELYKTKPLAYFEAIVKNKQKDIEDQKERDNKRLGHLPTNIY